MMTKRELEYCTISNIDNGRANSLPYPGDDYCMETLKELKDALQLYNNHYRGKEYDIAFTDGYNLKFTIQGCNLAHMLGINSHKLNGIEEFTNGSGRQIPTYMAIEKMIEKPEETIEINKRLGRGIFNFYRINVRCMAFSRFSNFSDFNFACINFDSGLMEDYDTNLKSSHLLFTESNDVNAPYFIMGLAYGSDGRELYVETLFPTIYPDNYFKNQRITIPSSMSVATAEDYTKIEATNRQKLDLTKKLSADLIQYNCYIDIYNDYINMLSIGSVNESRTKK